ncbi:MAG: hypothetical protein P9L93_02340 [Candidatus Gorgyraea atricola]|nr:hypothetical protein [Candidatus Gorgyraea atricola]
MMKIGKQCIIALILILIGVGACQEAYCLRVPIRNDKDNEVKVANKIARDKIKKEAKEIIAKLKTYQEEEWLQIDYKELRKYLTTKVLKHFNLSSDFIREDAGPGELLQEVGMLYNLASAELDSLDYSEVKSDAFPTIRATLNYYFAHTLGQITNYTYEIRKFLEVELVEKKEDVDIRRASQLSKALDSYEEPYSHWNMLFRKLEKLKSLNPKVIVALIDNFIAFYSELLDTMSQAETFLDKYKNNQKITSFRENVERINTPLINFIIFQEIGKYIRESKETTLVDINESLMKLVELYKNDTYAQIKLELDENIPHVYTNSLFMYQVWANLINDARQAIIERLLQKSIKKGVIIIKTNEITQQKDEKAVEVIFSDNGVYSEKEQRGSGIGATIIYKLGDYGVFMDIKGNNQEGADVVISFPVSQNIASNDQTGSAAEDGIKILKPEQGLVEKITALHNNDI